MKIKYSFYTKCERQRVKSRTNEMEDFVVVKKNGTKEV